VKIDIPKEWIERKAKEDAASGADCTAANPELVDHMMLPDTRGLECQPIDGASGRFICTRAQPMRPVPHGNSPARWIHPDAKDLGFDDAHFDHYLCPNCSLRFKVEVAD
jgi:hypothetical protein